MLKALGSVRSLRAPPVVLGIGAVAFGVAGLLGLVGAGTAGPIASTAQLHSA